MAIEETRWRGEPALRLRSGPTAVTFLPGLGMTGVSLRHEGREYLAAPGGPDALRAGHTLGLPLLAPWANRLGRRRYRVGRVAVDLSRRRIHTDGNGLPIHGVLVGAPGWRVEQATTRSGDARLRAVIAVDTPAFPFPHRIELRVGLRPGRLAVRTTVVPTGARPVPIAFGWHPYLRVPGAPRSRWRLTLPRRDHLLLDARGLPTGDRRPAAPESAPIGRRTVDDLFALGRRRVLALETDDAAVAVHADAAYPFAQVWVPPGRPFAALEPMTVPTNALVDGGVPSVEPGDAFSASYAVVLR
ncbi:MAG: aldose 1-epimerase [Actinomycetota bacterium]